MGSFVGHVVPGSFFVLFGLWWTVQILRRYYRCVQKKESFESSVCFAWNAGRSPELPKEGAVKIISALLGTAGEVYTGLMDPDGFPLGNGQHITMYFFFGLSGVADILTCKSVFPKDFHLDYVTFAMGFAMELLLFKFHLHGRVQLDVTVHKLLIAAIAANSICVVLEAFRRKNVLAALGRSYFSMLQGTWFIQLGFILYNPFPVANQKEDDPDQYMWTITLFAWHCIGVFLGTLLLASCIGYCSRKSLKDKVKYEPVSEPCDMLEDD